MKFTFIVILMLAAMLAHSQQYAGEEKICCSGNGAAIGIDNPNPDHCYVWAVADGLTADQVNQKTPIVKPDKTTWYNVTVTDQFFSFKAIDRVRVVVYFGGIKFYPTYIYPNGQPNQSKATLTENGYGSLPPEPFTWSVYSDPDGTGAVISQDGWISNCSQSGKVTIRATSTSNPDCYDEEIIEVNIGVKDLIVRDMANEGRMARAGETLHIAKSAIGTHPIQFQAIANDESVFPEGQPEWSGNLSPPGPGPTWIADVGSGFYTVTAGEKTVTVIVIVGASVTIQKSLDITPVKNWKEKFIDNISVPLQSPFCSPIPLGFTLPAENITLGVALEDVNKYKNKDLGTKTDFSISLPAISVGGCWPVINLLVYYNVPGTGDIIIFPYLRMSAGVTISGNVTKDPSMENSDWDGTINVIGKVDIAGGVTADASFGPFGLTGGTEVVSDMSMKCRLNEGKIEWNTAWGGVQAKFGGTIYFGSPSNPTWVVPYELRPKILLEGGETDFRTMIDLNQP